MGVPRLDQLADLPKPIGVRRRLSISVGEEPIDGSELPHAHVRRHVEGAGAIRLIRGLQAVPPVVVDGPPLLRQHEESDPEESDQLTFAPSIRANPLLQWPRSSLQGERS